MSVKIYHNPQCTKSRKALELLNEKDLSPEIILYLNAPPCAQTIEEIQSMLGVDSPLQMMRKNEEIFKTLSLEKADKAQLIDAMIKHPILIERPIVVINGKAAIGRPLENILAILP